MSSRSRVSIGSVRSFALVGCVMIGGCASAPPIAPSQPAAPASTARFDDARVVHDCACAPPRALPNDAQLGARSVREEAARLAKPWTGTLRWQPQRFFDVTTLSPLALTVTITPKQAYEITCSDGSAACRQGKFLPAHLLLDSPDHSVAVDADAELRLIGDEPIAQLPLAVPAALASHASQASIPALWLGMSFASSGHAELYVLAPEGGEGSASQQYVIGTAELTQAQ